VNHEAISRDDLQLLAFGNYGHYTSMQVRGRATRGLDLHLDRLDSNAIDLFGRAPATGAVVAALRHAVATRENCSVRVTIFSRDVAAVGEGTPVEPDVMVTVTAPAEQQHDPFRVLPVEYMRETPQVKHLATYGLLRQRRAARIAGYDDAIFLDNRGMLSEGSTWNLCLHDGDQWVWPEAPGLLGVTMQLLQGAMRQAGLPSETRQIPLESLAEFRSAFATNSVSPGRRLAAIGEHLFQVNNVSASVLRDLYESVPYQPL
jgi:branched-subunit amino acid aminotransferase/4-amino-4-deoxychorismate lyase